MTPNKDSALGIAKTVLDEYNNRPPLRHALMEGEEYLHYSEVLADALTFLVARLETVLDADIMALRTEVFLNASGKIPIGPIHGISLIRGILGTQLYLREILTVEEVPDEAKP